MGTPLQCQSDDFRLNDYDIKNKQTSHLSSWSAKINKTFFVVLHQMVLMESRAPLRKIALWCLVVGAARPLRACNCWSRSKQSEWRIQYQASAWRSARKLQTLGKCSSTNLESFTFRLLTQLSQGVFLRSASAYSLFDAYFVKNERNDKRK